MDEQEETARWENETPEVLQRLVTAFYTMCFYAEVGSRAHSFIEFNGLMGEYVKMLRSLRERGVPISLVNEHCGPGFAVPAYHLQYMAEKMRCIFGPFLRDEGQRKIFLDELLK